MCCEENPPFDYWRFSSRESNQDGIRKKSSIRIAAFPKGFQLEEAVVLADLLHATSSSFHFLPLCYNCAIYHFFFFIGLFSDYTKRSIGKTFPASAENNITLWTFLHFSLASFLASKIKVICHLSLHFSFFCSCYILRIVIVTHQASSGS